MIQEGSDFFQNTKFCPIFNVYNSADNQYFKFVWIANLMPSCSVSYQCQPSHWLTIGWVFSFTKLLPLPSGYYFFSSCCRRLSNLCHRLPSCHCNYKPLQLPLALSLSMPLLDTREKTYNNKEKCRQKSEKEAEDVIRWRFLSLSLSLSLYLSLSLFPYLSIYPLPHFQ